MAVALSLGAAVFVWPVQALQCPRPLFWRSDMPVDEAFGRMVQFASRKVAEAQSIFKGRIVKVEFVGPDVEYPVLILTYEVDKWLKGDGRQNAKLVYGGWCDGPCNNIVRMMDSLKYDEEGEIYIADHINSSFLDHYPNLPRDTDGIFGLCSRLGRSIRPINQPYYRSPSHREFLFHITMMGQIEKLLPKPD
ncbi:hypothetical protein [Microvirga sp. 2TAF3]|uniref:hypothetical protein n=1 Tax=Microvirga sp. 2TAF3 TaxID=3233014 RepID=UPI003F99445D